METEKVFVKSDNTVNIKCPYCRLVRTVSIEKFKDPNKINKIKCRCAKIFNVTFEFRKMYRKETELQGTYRNKSAEDDEGRIVINNLSLGGVGFFVEGAHNIGAGNELLVEFRLDDQQKTLISRKARVKMIKGNYIGAEFLDVAAYDKYLGFYLMP
jgi:hypothetical protein